MNMNWQDLAALGLVLAAAAYLSRGVWSRRARYVDRRLRDRWLRGVSLAQREPGCSPVRCADINPCHPRWFQGIRATTIPSGQRSVIPAKIKPAPKKPESAWNHELTVSPSTNPRTTPVPITIRI